MFLFNIGRMARAHEGRGGVVIELKGEREALKGEREALNFEKTKIVHRSTVYNSQDMEAT